MIKKYTFLFLFISSISYSQGEPWKRPLKICSSNDALTFSNVQTFQDSAGVPAMVKLQSGVLLCAFQWFRQPVGSLSWDRVAVKFSSDNGITWTPPVPIVVSGLPSNYMRPFDPTPVLTDSGRIRLYFSSGLSMIPDTSVNTYSAISSDGINYTMEQGIRFSMPDKPVIDPAAVKFKNLWHLVNPITNMGASGAFHNISTDGLNFMRVADIPSDMTHSWIGNFMIKDTNELRFYGSGMMIWYSASTNGGVWSGFINTNITGGDPTVLKLSDANYIMVYTGPPYPVSVTESESKADEFSLGQNYPNPFNPTTMINYQCAKSNFISLRVFDVLGNEVAILVNEKKVAGSYKVDFDGRSYPSGVYYYKLEAGDFRQIRKMLLVK